MAIYVLRRFLHTIVTLIGVTVILFFIFAMAPSDFVDQNAAVTPERAAELRALYGLDRPLLERYWTWLTQTLQGDLGESFVHKRPVGDVIHTYMWNSFLLSFAAFLLTWTISIMFGAAAAMKPGRWLDRWTTLLAFAGMSLPTFFLCMLCIKLFAVDVRWFPLSGMSSTGQSSTGLHLAVDVAYHMVLPVLVLTFVGAGGPSRYVRSDMIEVLKQEYIRTARAKGLPERTVIMKHALRNALIPVITLMSFDVSVLFSGALITETIFNWPGIGRIGVEAIQSRDYPLLMGYNLLLALATIACTFLSDIVYGLADPRIRYR